MPEYAMSAAECHALDQLAISELGVSEYQLMQRAGAAAIQMLVETWPEAGRIVVYCGPGNNGGDGYLLAAYAKQLGIAVRVLALGEPGSETARRARQFALDQRVAIDSISEVLEHNLEPGAQLAVDALFGHGLVRDIGEPLASLFEHLNNSDIPVLSLDVPSGINSDTGSVMGTALRAEATLCFVAPKIGLMTGQGLDYAGDTVHHKLGIPDRVAGKIEASYRVLHRELLEQALSPPGVSSHKGDFGHVAVIGGQTGMPGAVILAATAAIRAGAGRVTAISSEDHARLIPLANPVLMTAVIDSDSDFNWPEGISALVLGPGLGASAGWSRSVYETSLEYAVKKALPVVLDADGLNLLADDYRHYDSWILTPHPGEAARLLACSVAEIQADRPAACRRIAEKYGGICVLKGAGTLVGAGRGALAVCRRGNWGMATAGSGDVLSGIAGACLAMGMPPSLAAEVGVYLHAWLGDLAAENLSHRGMIASDLVELLPQLYRQLEKSWK